LIFTQSYDFKVVSRWTGIPVATLDQREKDKLIHLAARLHERVVGQDEAVNKVARAVLRSRTGLSQPGQPIGSFLFLGTTGVGKTELAKALAEQLFDSEKMLVRVDMSEYVGAESVWQLIGAPPGHVFYIWTLLHFCHIILSLTEINVSFVFKHVKALMAIKMVDN
jgi:ATP-dependent Clp protease ATP-binding subunit ClpA